MPKQSYPDWVHEIVDWKRLYDSPEERMQLALDIALRSVYEGGGPFGAVIAGRAGKIIAAGFNCVLLTNDCTAHAEVMALRSAGQKVTSRRIDAADEYDLFSSSAPCIMCFGAIWWARVKRVYWAAEKAEPEALGFQEGPIGAELWQELSRQQGVEIFPRFGRSQTLEQISAAFRQRGELY